MKSYFNPNITNTGIYEGYSYGTVSNIVKNLQMLMKNLQLTFEDGCAGIEVTPAQYAECCELVNEMMLHH